jgi:type II secretory pathway pseudopilin PulG
MLSSHQRYRNRRTAQAGDTLIEVLFAFAVLSLVIVGALSIMNQGAVSSQRALETTLVREEIDSQATTLRFLHDAYVSKFQSNGSYVVNTPAGQWVQMAAAITATTSSTFGNITTCPAAPSKSFILDPSNATFVSDTTKLVKATTYAQIQYAVSGQLQQSQGIWIEAVRSVAETDPNKKNTRYIDFHINACWDGPGQGIPMTIGTIVRLYEPQN